VQKGPGSAIIKGESALVEGSYKGLATRVGNANGAPNNTLITSGGTANAASGAGLNQVLSTAEKANPLVESLRSTGELPPNYLTKDDAIQNGWRPGKALGNSVADGQIGGDIFENSTGVLPSAPGRVWYEADIGLTNTMSRSNQPGTRLLYSSDGLLYGTADHYETVFFIGKWK
jgi:filamentous hemagglutinin